MRWNALLWTVQLFLAVVFLFAGGMKLAQPIDALTLPVRLPAPFIRFLGGAELIGAAGLVLPRALRIRPVLTPLAATGLTIIVSGATVINAISHDLKGASFTLVLACLCAMVAYGRWSR